AMNVLMIVMAACGEDHVEPPFIGSVANRVLRQSASHVLLVRKTENMEHYREILIPTDGSDDAMYAANAGMSLAKRYDAGVCACTIVDSKDKIIERHVTTLKEVERGMVLGDTLIYPEAIVKRMRKRLFDEASKIAEEVREIAAKNGVSAEILVRDGKAAPEILKIVKEKNVDLVVLGSHGRGTLSRTMAGPVSEKVASMVECSVLVVRSSRAEETLPE
ncbi:MAG TPA: universal stress protein, partial [Candidatus Methanoperedenaceae archaeon]|nr:universal stress protein [Candidatus Methanoperedenaceae archaeon]